MAITNRAEDTEPFEERITSHINLYGDTSQFHKYRRHRSLLLPNWGYLAEPFYFSLYDLSELLKKSEITCFLRWKEPPVLSQ